VRRVGVLRPLFGLRALPGNGRMPAGVCQPVQ
jgi:hypothetical protein